MNLLIEIKNAVNEKCIKQERFGAFFSLSRVFFQTAPQPAPGRQRTQSEGF